MLKFAAGLGFEPRLNVPETSVLPLDDPANSFLKSLNVYLRQEE